MLMLLFLQKIKTVFMSEVGERQMRDICNENIFRMIYLESFFGASLLNILIKITHQGQGVIIIIKVDLASDV